MPDGRFISKSISHNEQLPTVSLLADFLFSRCIPHLDVGGKMSGNPALVKAIVVPLRREFTEESIAVSLLELEVAELIYWHVTDGKQVLEFPGFARHQKGIKTDREAPSRYPSRTKSSTRCGTDSGSTQDEIRISAGPSPEKIRLSEVKLSESKSLSTSEELHAAAPRRKKRAPRKAPARNSSPAATLDDSMAELDERDCVAAEAKAAQPEEPKPKRVTWLTPYVGPWEKRFGTGSFPFGKAAKVLSPFKGRPPEEEGARLERFLQETDAKYASLHRFAETHDSWRPDGDEGWNMTDRSKPNFVGVVDGWMSPELERLTRPS